jgi:RNA 3'-terminal phosphate cyclase (ATP)
MIEIDGSLGEGGGQVLRTALTLSMITGQPFRIFNIRARRSKPGLMRQHLVSVQAAARISDAEVLGAEQGSLELAFSPHAIKGGDYGFAIGTAGSCMLVLQTVMPALLFADKPSTVHVSGGTHNPLAPPTHFLQRAYCPAMAEMGAGIDVDLQRFGFYPAGGGEAMARITPNKALKAMDWIERGALKSSYAEAFIAGLPAHLARAELKSLGDGLGWKDECLHLRELPRDQGPGNALLVTLEYERVTEVFSAFAEKTIRPDALAASVMGEVKRYVDSGAALDEYLADQLMLPLALAGGGSFSCESVSLHARTNATVIERFLPVRFEFKQAGTRHLCSVSRT